MKEKKFVSPAGAVTGEEIEKDYESAKVYDKVRTGEKGVYYKEGFHTCFVPYEYIEKAFIRVQQVNGRCCCGSTKYDYYRIVLVHDGKEFAEIFSEKEKECDDALAAIGAKGRHISIGV